KHQAEKAGLPACKRGAAETFMGGGDHPWAWQSPGGEMADLAKRREMLAKKRAKRRGGSQIRYICTGAGENVTNRQERSGRSADAAGQLQRLQDERPGALLGDEVADGADGVRAGGEELGLPFALVDVEMELLVQRSAQLP